MDRRAQLRDLFRIEFPDELFEFWDWYGGLSAELKQTFVDHGGMRPHGVCDVLDGKFDGVKLRYPAVLHWRFRLDPPEFITVLTGDTDGLHWGFWFDDPKQPPVIAGNYARDAYEFWVAGNSLFEMIEGQIDKAIEGCEENLEYDKNYADDYRRHIADLKQLAKLVPSSKVKREKRTPTRATDEGMGIVVPRASWDGVLAADKLDGDDALDTCIGWIDQGKAGVALFHAKQMWVEDHDVACKIMERAYRALGRDALAAIAKAHGENPTLPSVNVLDYKMGDFTSFSEARAAAVEVKKLEVGGEKLKVLPDLSAMVNLEELLLWGNELTTLPASLASCKALRMINAFRNQLATLPLVVADLPALVELQLAKNKIATVGDAIRGCRALEELDLSDNPVTSLAEAIGELPALRSLNLASTQLVQLPASLGTCASLQFLALSSSKLTSLPPDLSGWRQLRRVAVANTPLPASELERLRAAAPSAEIVT